MIIRLVKMTFHEKYSEQFELLFAAVKSDIASFEGCQQVELLAESTKDSKAIYFTRSIWNKESNLESYRSSDLFARTWKSTKALFADRPQAWTTQLIAKATSDRK